MLTITLTNTEQGQGPLSLNIVVIVNLYILIVSMYWLVVEFSYIYNPRSICIKNRVFLANKEPPQTKNL